MENLFELELNLNSSVIFAIIIYNFCNFFKKLEPIEKYFNLLILFLKNKKKKREIPNFTNLLSKIIISPNLPN